MQSNPWQIVLKNRISRRRSLALAAGAPAGALFLAACGRGGNGRNGDEASPTPASEGFLTPLSDSSAEAVRGGTLRTNIANTVSLDPITGLHGGYKVQNSPLYNRIFQGVPGILERSRGEITGDAADRWEMSPDGLELIVTLRPNLGTDPRPPVDGRMLDAEDIRWSWELFASESTVRAALVNDIDPTSPVTGISAPDEHTVIFHLAAPSALLEGYLADGFYFWIIPREAEDQYDPRNEAHGAGPWYNDRFEPDVAFRMVRNPNYYEPDLPYLDSVEIPVLGEQAALLAQLEAGQIDISSTVYGNAGITNENVLDVYNRHPEMTLFGLPSASTGRHLWVGYGDDSPYRDIRMRQALSMLMNRADLAEYFTSADRLTRAGLPTEPTWVSHLAHFYPGSADLRDSVFDASRSFLEFNPEEAQKLMAAAGWEGLSTEVMYSSGALTERDGNVIAEQLRQNGLTISERVLDINQEFSPNVTRIRGNHSSIAMHTLLQGYTARHLIYTNLHPTPETTAIRSRDDFPELTELADAILTEFDDERVHALAHEWMVRAAADLPTIPVGSVGYDYHVAWPWLRNAGVFQRWLGSSVNNVEVFRHYWYDASKDTRTS